MQPISYARHQFPPEVIRHTRAALTGLRQKGYAIERDKSPQGKTVYRLPARARG